MKLIALLGVTILFAGCASNPSNLADERLLKAEFPAIARQEKWRNFNGDMELGEIDRPVPGYFIKALFNPDAIVKNPSKDYYPVTKREKNGNHYLEMPGYSGLPEYNLSTDQFFLPKDGTVELSFKAKMAPALDGKRYQGNTTSIDFRCWTIKKYSGSVKTIYPVLFGKGFKPEQNWKTFTFKIQAKGGFPYSFWIRHSGKRKEDTLNTLCLDDLSIKYSDDNRPIESQVALLADKLVPAYQHGQLVKFKVNALLGKDNSHTLFLNIREDNSNTRYRSIKVKVTPRENQQTVDGRQGYTGECHFKADRYGSFNTLVTREDGSPLFSKGGDFVILHDLPKEASSLQRRLGGHFRTYHWGFSMLPSNQYAYLMDYGMGLEKETETFARFGFRQTLYSFGLKKVQPKPETIDLSLSSTELALLKKYNIEPVGLLGGWWIYADKRRKRGDLIVSTLPDWYYQDKYTRDTGKVPGKYSRVLKDKYWRIHVGNIISRFSNQIDKWMLPQEPQWIMSASDYLDLQKSAYEIIKNSNSKAMLIAGDATSDAGYNLTGWIQSLHDLGFEKYCDAVSYNPYGSDTDYMNGVLYRNSDLVKRLRDILKPGTTLWEQELHFITNSKRSGADLKPTLFTAGDVQRHYLLSLLNNLRGVSVTTPHSFYKYVRTPNDVAAGFNYLSWMLHNKSEAKHLDLKNKLLRCVIINDAKKHSCAAALWVLKPQGAHITPTTNKVALFDCFGNALERLDRISIGLDPIFLTGDYQELKAFLMNSTYSMGNPVIVRMRNFGERSFLEAQNKSGGKSAVTIDFDAATPNVRLMFKENDYTPFILNGKLSPLSYSASLPGMTQAQKKSIIPIAPVKEFIIPTNQSNALPLQLQNTATLLLWTSANSLHIQAKVKDKQLTPALNDSLWSADALEVFIDRTPFARLDSDEHAGKLGLGLTTRQYGFSPLPSKTGKQIQLIDTRSRKVLSSEATVKTETWQGGYTLNVEIPFAELRPRCGDGDIIGMTFELSLRNGDRKLEKVIFGSSNKPGYKYRFHYPLFSIPALKGQLTENGGFENGLMHWSCFLGNAGLELSGDSYTGKNAVKINLIDKPTWGKSLRRGVVSYKQMQLLKGDYRLSFYAKGDKLDHVKVKLGDSLPKELKTGDLPISNEWTRYTLPFHLEKESQTRSIYFEFLAQRQDKDAYAIIDNVRLIYFGTK